VKAIIINKPGEAVLASVDRRIELRAATTNAIDIDEA
jgi:hypothetical protein